jgi:hypothetical protein
MLVFIATSIFIVALFPIIYFLIIRDQTTKAFPFAVVLIIIFASFFLYFNKGTAIGSFSEYLVLTEINQDIGVNTALSPVSLTNSVTNLSQDEKAIFINQLFQDALQQNSLESAASLLAFANSVLQDGEYQSILLLMYADLRDKRFPELLQKFIEIKSYKNDCKISKFYGAAFLTNGPKIPISESSSETSIFRLTQDDYVVRGFDLVSATLNNENITLSLDLVCGETSYFTSLEIAGEELLANDIVLEIENNAWLKREQ